jgi:hypothetical protein
VAAVYGFIMHPTNYFSFWYLFLRSLLPTIASFIASSIIAFAVIGVHVLLLSINDGAMLPHSFDTLGGNWSPIHVTRPGSPFGTVVHNSYVKTGVFIVLWALVAWVAFKLVEMVVMAVRSMREDQKSVYVPAEMVIVHHPLRRALAARLAWRFCILVIAVSLAMLAQPLMQHIWIWDKQISQADTLPGVLRYLLVVYAAWMVLLHMSLVFLRLFLLRTRVYGEMVH